LKNSKVNYTRFTPGIAFLDSEFEKRHPCAVIQEICSKLKMTEPQYIFKEVKLGPQKSIFECKCIIQNLKCYGQGSGKNKKLAKSNPFALPPH